MPPDLGAESELEEEIENDSQSFYKIDLDRRANNPNRLPTLVKPKEPRFNPNG